MFEPETVEAYFEWCLLHPLAAAELDWDSYRGVHSELLGYTRWCAQKRKEFEEQRPTNRGNAEALQKTAYSITDSTQRKGNKYEIARLYAGFDPESVLDPRKMRQRQILENRAKKLRTQQERNKP